MMKLWKLFQSALRTKALPVPMPYGPQKKTWSLDESAIEGSEKPPIGDIRFVAVKANLAERTSPPADAAGTATSAAKAISPQRRRRNRTILQPPSPGSG